MTPAQYQRLMELLEQASALRGAEREHFLQHRGNDDPVLHARLRELLRFSGEAEADPDLGDIGKSVRVVAADVAATSAAAAPRTSPLAGARLGSYELLGLIGEGGMGAVYRARQDHPRRIVAVKIIRSALSSPELVRRFEREAETLGRLHHPGIAHVYEAGFAPLEFPAHQSESGARHAMAARQDRVDTTLDARAAPTPQTEMFASGLPQPFIAMEFVQGVSLNSVIHNGTRSIRDRLAFIARICDAVHHAHTAGIIHRDLKPGNILVVDENDLAGSTVNSGDGSTTVPNPPTVTHSPQPKILDFGIARMIDTGDAPATLQTELGQLVGTIPYMSPEQIAGDSRQLDARTDVYSIGVILFELLTGRLPYDIRNCSVPEAARIIREEEPSRLSRTGSRWRSNDFDRDIETIVSKTLEKDRARRYASAAELAADIRRLLRDEPIVARPASSFYQFRKFARRHRTLVIGTAATFFALFAGLVVALVLYRQAVIAQRAADDNAQTAQRNEREARRLAYRSSIAAATAALLSDDVVVAEANLDRVPADLRGWEWRHFKSRLDASNAATFVTNPVGYFTYLVFSPADDELYCMIGRWPLCPVVERFDAATTAVLPSRYFPDSLAIWFSQSGEYIVSIGFDRVIQVTHAPTMRTIARYPTTDGFSALNGHITVSDNGRWIVYHSVDRDLHPEARTMRVDLETGALRTCELPLGMEMRVSPDGDVLVRDREVPDVILWRSADDTWSRITAGDGNIRATAFSPDGRRFATGGFDNNVRLWDTQSLTCIAVGRGHRDSLERITFSNDGNSLATAGRDRTIRIWDVPTLAPRGVLSGHRAPLVDVAFSHDNRQLASLDAGGSLRFWNLSDAINGDVLRGHTSYVYSIAFSRDGSTLASAGWDHTIRIWDTASRKLRRVLSTQMATVERLAFGSNTNCLIAHGFSSRPDRSTEWWDAEHGILIGGRADTEWSPLLTDLGDHELIVKLDLESRNAVLWNPSTNTVRSEVVDVDQFHLSDAAFAPRDVNFRIRVLDEYKLMLRDANTNHWSFQHDASWSGSYCIAPPSYPGNLVAAPQSSTNDVLVWNMDNHELVARLSGHTDELFAVAWSPDGTRLASGGRDQVIRLWDTTSWEEVAQLHGHTSYVWSLLFSPDGSQLASASGDYTVRIWDTRSREER